MGYYQSNFRQILLVEVYQQSVANLYERFKATQAGIVNVFALRPVEMFREEKRVKEVLYDETLVVYRQYLYFLNAFSLLVMER